MLKLRLTFIALMLASAPALASDPLAPYINQGKVEGAQLGANSPINTYQQQTGLPNVSPIGSSPQTGQVGYDGQENYAAVFHCKGVSPQNPYQVAAGGVSVQATSCQITGTGPTARIQSINIQMCDLGRVGGVCNPSNYTPEVTLYTNQSQILSNDVAVSLGNCPADGSMTCPAVVFVHTAAITTGANLKSQASQEAATQSADSGQGMLQQSYNNGDYQASVQTVGGQYNTCYQGVQNSLGTNGLVYSCDNKQSVQFTAPQGQCNQPPQCLQWASNTTNWTESCNVDVPVESQNCTTVTPTKDCNVQMSKQSYTCDKTLSVNVTETQSCVPGTWFEQFNTAFGDWIWTGGSNGFNAGAWVLCEPTRTDNALTFYTYLDHWYPGGGSQPNGPPITNTSVPTSIGPNAYLIGVAHPSEYSQYSTPIYALPGSGCDSSYNCSYRLWYGFMNWICPNGGIIVNGTTDLGGAVVDAAYTSAPGYCASVSSPTNAYCKTTYQVRCPYHKPCTRVATTSCHYVGNNGQPLCPSGSTVSSGGDCLTATNTPPTLSQLNYSTGVPIYGYSPMNVNGRGEGGGPYTLTFVQPHQIINTTDTWNDGCAQYEAAQ